MESEGPYKLDEENGQCCVVGPGYQKPGARITQNGDYWPTRMLQLDMNLAYAAGRKAAESYTAKMLELATAEVRKCHEEIRRLEDKYARNFYRMPNERENALGIE